MPTKFTPFQRLLNGYQKIPMDKRIENNQPTAGGPSLEALFAQVDLRLTAASQQARRQAGAEGLRLNQLYYLNAIHALGLNTLTGLAAHFQVSKPAATAVVQKLLEQGYAEKSRSEQDRRVYYLRLSAKGLRVVSIKEDAFRQFAGQIRSHLGPGASAELERLLAMVLEAPQA